MGVASIRYKDIFMRLIAHWQGRYYRSRTQPRWGAAQLLHRLTVDNCFRANNRQTIFIAAELKTDTTGNEKGPLLSEEALKPIFGGVVTRLHH
jgi:hypothetical protein